MGTDKTNQLNQETLTVRDLRALADRLHARGHSLIFEDQPDLQGDLKLAATVIRALVHDRAPDETLALGRRQ
jgi:hypothetical protein